MIRRKNSMRKELVGMALAAVAALALSASSALALPSPQTGTGRTGDTQLLGYISTGTAGNAATVTNITNPVEDNGTSGDPDIICAMIYVFDAHQLLQECCGCPVSSDGLRTLNNRTDLADEAVFLPPGSTITTGLVRIVSAQPNGCDSLGGPLGAACLSGGGLNQICDATGGTYPAGQYHSPGSPFLTSAVTAGEGIAGLRLVEDLRAWGTHIQNAALTESEYVHNPLSRNDANSLAEACGDIQFANSATGPGVCSCGTGD
jgi:hypothetical protein